MGDGVSAQRITSNTFKIVVHGNAITSGLATQDYTALKAAETAKQAGGTHFVFISATDASSEGPVTTGGKAKKTATGSTLAGTASVLGWISRNMLTRRLPSTNSSGPDRTRTFVSSAWIRISRCRQGHSRRRK